MIGDDTQASHTMFLCEKCAGDLVKGINEHIGGPDGLSAV